MDIMCGKRIIEILVFASLVVAVSSNCTPSEVSDALQTCLQYQALNTYWQFPFVAAASFSSLCANSTCLTYCYDLTTIPCTGEYYNDHLGNGDAVKAAYFGFCDVGQSETEAALTCGNSVANQDVLNAASLFQTTLQGYATNNIINATAICVDFRTLLDTLTTKMTEQCSGAPQTLWTQFFNTLYAACDGGALSPSFFADYKDTPNIQCRGASLFVDVCFLIVCVFLSTICGFIH